MGGGAQMPGFHECMIHRPVHHYGWGHKRVMLWSCSASLLVQSRCTLAFHLCPSCGCGQELAALGQFDGLGWPRLTIYLSICIHQSF